MNKNETLEMCTALLENNGVKATGLRRWLTFNRRRNQRIEMNERTNANWIATCGTMLLVAVLSSMAIAVVGVPGDVAVAEDVYSDMNGLMEMMYLHGSTATYKRVSKKGKKGKSSKGKSKTDPAADAAATEVAGEAEPGDGDSFRSGGARRRTHGRTGMFTGGAGVAQTFPVPLISQQPLNERMGTDVLFSAGYTGYRPAGGGATEVSTGGAESTGFLTVDATGQLNINPRVYMSQRAPGLGQDADIARRAAHGSGGLWGRVNYVMNNHSSAAGTAEMNEMNEDLHFAGYLEHWTQMCYQLGAWVARASVALTVERYAEQARPSGLAGITAEHERTPYDKLHRHLKTFFEPTAAHLDTSKADYTLQEWFEGFSNRFKSQLMTDVTVGGMRARLPIHGNAFSMGFMSYEQGVTQDNDGNALFLFPELGGSGAFTGSASYATRPTELGFLTADGDDTLTFSRQQVGEHDDAVFPVTAIDSGHAGWEHIGAHYKECRAATGGTVGDYAAADGVLKTNASVMPQLGPNDENDETYLNPSNYGFLWTGRPFIGGHNIVDMHNGADTFIPFQSMIFATPDQLIDELNYWAVNYPQEVHEYITAMLPHTQQVSDLMPYFGPTQRDWNRHVDEVNFRSVYDPGFNPRRSGPWHYGPADQPESWMRQAQTHEGFNAAIASRFDQLKVLTGLGHSTLASSLSNDATDLVKQVDPALLSALGPQGSQVAKGERSIAVPANRSKESIYASAMTEATGKEWIEALLKATVQPPYEYRRQFPASDIDVNATRVSEVTSYLLPWIHKGGNATDEGYASNVLTLLAQNDQLTQTAMRDFLISGPCNMDSSRTIANFRPEGWMTTTDEEFVANLGKSRKAKLKAIEDPTGWACPHPTVSLMGAISLMANGGGGAPKWQMDADNYLRPTIPGEIVYVGDRSMVLTVSGFPLKVVGTGFPCGTGANQLDNGTGYKIEAIGSFPTVHASSLLTSTGSATSNVVAKRGDKDLFLTAYHIGEGSVAWGLDVGQLSNIWGQIWSDERSLTGAYTHTDVPLYGLHPTGGQLELLNEADQRPRVQLAYMDIVKTGGQVTFDYPTSVKTLVEAAAANGDCHPFFLDTGDGLFFPTEGVYDYERIFEYIDNESSDEELVPNMGEPYSVRYELYLQRTINEAGNMTSQMKQTGQAATQVPSMLLNIVKSTTYSYPVKPVTAALKYAFQANQLYSGSDFAYNEVGGYGHVTHFPETTAADAAQGWKIVNAGEGDLLVPRAIVPNNVKIHLKHELDYADWAVLAAFTPKEARIPFLSGTHDSIFHGQLLRSEYGILTEAGFPSLAKQKMPGRLHQKDNTEVFRFDVCQMAGVIPGAMAWVNEHYDLVALMGWTALTRELIYDIEESSRYGGGA